MSGEMAKLDDHMNENHDALDALAKLDLNLLVALDAMLELRHITRAAKRVGVTQSTMSHILKRLRAAFDDQLLVRDGNVMVLTPRAESLAQPLRAALVELSRALREPTRFDPETTTRAFTIACPALFSTLYLPDLMHRLASAAPGARVVIAPGFDDVSGRLATGELDLAIAPVITDDERHLHSPGVGPDVRIRKLFTERFVLFMHRDHPLATHRSDALELAMVADAKHIFVSPTGRGAGRVDALLRHHNLERRIILRVPDYASALTTASHTELVVMAPSSLASHAASLDLVAVEISPSLDAHTIGMLWHPRADSARDHQWFRELFSDTIGRARAQRSPG